MISTKKQFIAALVLFSFFIFPFPALAVTGNCTGYAWGENVGWINFNPKDGGVTVTSTGLTGYAWAENVGWIQFDYAGTGAGALNTTSTNWGVTNDGHGNLAGYAWAENVGWINFHSTNSQVLIDASGNFSGYAWAENVGWIQFDHAQTSYRPATTWSVPVSSNQEHFQIYKDDATINNATAWASQDTNYNVALSTNFRIRFEVANTGTAPISIVRRLEFREYSGSTWGAWTQIATSGNNVNLSTSAFSPYDGVVTTSKLTAVGTFMAGQGKDADPNTSSISLTNAYYTEDEYSLKFGAGASGNTYQFRITNAGVALDSYTATPSISPGAVSILKTQGVLRVKGTMRIK